MNNLGILFPLIILALFVPMLLGGRRQKRQAQEMQNLQANLAEGDVVTTTSGLRGTVVDTSYEDSVDLEIAPGVVTTWLRAAVREKVNQEEAASETAESSESAAAPAVKAAKEEAPEPSAAAPAGTEDSAKDEPADATKAEAAGQETDTAQGGTASETGTPARDRGTA